MQTGLPAGADNWLDEYAELRSGAGVIDAGSNTEVELVGPDAASFLNRMCTNQVDGLAPRTGCEAFLTDAKAHVLAYVLVFRCPGSLVLHTAAGQGAKLIAHLDRYLIRDKVELHDRSGSRREFLLAGERSKDVFSALGWAVPGEGHLNHVDVDWAGGKASIRRLELGGPAMFLIAVPAEAAGTAWQMLQNAGARPCGQLAGEAIRIEAGWPVYGIDVTEENLPQEVGRDRWAISYSKGCYLGQETVARIASRGHVNRMLVGLKFPTGEIPAPGAELTADGALAGRVTSATFSPRLGSALALGYVRRGNASVGARLASSLGPVEVVSLPLRNR